MAATIDTYFCPECQKQRGGEDDEVEPEVPPPVKEKERTVEHKANLRSPASAPATPLDLPKVSPNPFAQSHSVTPPAPVSRNKRKGTAMRAISKLTTILPPPALPAPEILAREAAKFKTEPLSAVSASLLDFASTVLPCGSHLQTDYAQNLYKLLIMIRNHTSMPHLVRCLEICILSLFLMTFLLSGK